MWIIDDFRAVWIGGSVFVKKIGEEERRKGGDEHDEGQ